MKKWWALYVGVPWDKRVVWGAVVLSLLPITFASLRGSNPAAAPEVAGVDTHIPRGFVLVPIEAENYESLDSILGRFGWVDLFQGGGEGTEGAPRRLVARNVRLLRAPNNPSHFAVLVPERQASHVLRTGGAFTVVVKRPADGGTEFVNSTSSPAPTLRRRITYEDK